MAEKTKELLISQLDPAGWTDIPAGFRIYKLWEDPKTGASIALFACPKGVGVPTRHVHASNQFMYCLAGEYEYTTTGITLKPGSFYMNPKGHPHGPTMAHEDSVLIEIYDGPHYFETPPYHAADTVGRIAKRPKQPAKAATAAKKTSGPKKAAPRQAATKKTATKKPAKGAAKKAPVKPATSKKTAAVKPAVKRAATGRTAARRTRTRR